MELIALLEIPNPTRPGTNFFSAKSSPIFIKLAGYLHNHLPTWSMMSWMTPFFKSSVRNLQHPPSPHLHFLSQIMSDIDQTIRICPLATTNMNYYVNEDPILQVSSQEPSTSSKPTTYAFSAKSYPIKLPGYAPWQLTTLPVMFNLTQSFKSPVRNDQHPQVSF